MNVPDGRLAALLIDQRRGGLGDASALVALGIFSALLLALLYVEDFSGSGNVTAQN